MDSDLKFTSEEEFKTFLKSHQESGNLIHELALYKPYEITINSFLKLDWVILSFGNYSRNNIALKFSKSTNEFFVGDLNMGGHAAKSRILKLDRNDIFNSSEKLIKWTANRCAKLWES